MTATEVAERADAVRQRIADAGGDPDAVAIVAVTKGFGADAARAAVEAGMLDLGENYAQELTAKAAEVPEARWHFLGSVQRNKVAELAPLVTLWHGVDRVEEAASIARHRPGAAVLVQVNLSGEPHRAGCELDEVDRVVAGVGRAGVEVRGLMGVGPAGPPEKARDGFRALAAAAGRLGLTEVSMGMSADLEVAVSEGATIVRIGTALFGPRPQAAAARR